MSAVVLSGGRIVGSGGSLYAVNSGGGATLIFSYPSGFAGAGGNIAIAGGTALISGGLIYLTTSTSGAHQAGGAWYTTQQNITSFTTDFTFQQGTPTTTTTTGMFFVVQASNSSTNTPPFYGTGAVADANGEGFGDYLGQDAAIGNSVGVKFDLSSFNQNAYFASQPSGTGLYVDGGPYMGTGFSPETDMAPLGINLWAAHLMSCKIVYDGTILTMVLTDTVSGVSARFSWPVDIPSIVGGNSAWVGFTGGSTYNPNQTVNSWDWYQGYNSRLSTPTFSPAPGNYSTSQSVTISASGGAAIYYTTNGLPPTSASTLYTGAFSIASNEIVQAVAVQSNFTDSAIGYGNYQIQSGSLPFLNLPSGFSGATNLVTPAGYAIISGSSLVLTDTTGTSAAQSGSGWYNAAVNIQTFTTVFTISITNAGSIGMAFVIQNQYAATSRGSNSGGPFAVGDPDNGGGAGYGLMGNSVAVVFDEQGTGNETGIAINGASPTLVDMTSAGISLSAGHALQVTLTYSGTTLSQTVLDTVNSNSFSHSYTINIPSTVGANTAWIGFTACNAGHQTAHSVTTWTYKN